MAISRRDFLQGAAGAVAYHALNRGKTSERSSYDAEWNMRDYFAEFIKDFKFPYDSNLLCPPRVFTSKTDYDESLLKKNPHVKSDIRNQYYAYLDFWAKNRADFLVEYGPSSNSLRYSKEFLGAEGKIAMIIPIEYIENDRVFYRISRREGSGSYKPISPLCAFMNPVYRNSAIIYALADDHKFENDVDSAICPDYYYTFLRNFLTNPSWHKNVDSSMKNNISRLKEIFNLARAMALIVNANMYPDCIIKGGDDIGIQDYVFVRQGLPIDDYEGNPWKLWWRERIMGILGPIVPMLEIEGNHDGGGIKDNPAYQYAKEARKALWPHPGFFSGCSPDENYYVIPLANGKIEIYALDVVEQSASDNGYSPCRPEDFNLGFAQTKWLEDRLNRSKADFKFICYHHIPGGWPRTPDGKGWGGYGRGNGFTRDYYERLNTLFAGKSYIHPPIDVDRVQQPEITGMAHKYNVCGFIKAHDHVRDFMKIGQNERGDDIFSLTLGTTRRVKDTTDWMNDLLWQLDYGKSEDMRFLSSPTMERITISGDAILTEAICASDTERDTNLRDINAQPGQVVRKNLIQNGKIIF